jgi:hypothetical protein
MIEEFFFRPFFVWSNLFSLPGMYEFVLNKRQACMAHVCFVSVLVPSKKTVQTVPSIHN